jgi:hypothetical protein
MDDHDNFNTLTEAFQAFLKVVQSVPDDLYLSPINGWSTRDVVAHLVGWNRNMIEAGKEILRGGKPSYYPDAPNDYKNINGAFVSLYSSRDKTFLLNELAVSLSELEAFVHGLDPSERTADYGVVHYRGGPATIARLIDSLAGDYQYHRNEIQEWLNSKGLKMP